MKHLVYSIIISLCLVSIISSCSSKEERGGGLLWKISGKDLTEPSYLFGTWHGDTELRNASFLDSVPGLHEAFNSVSQFINESDLWGRGVEPSQKMYMPKDTTYADILSHSGLQILDSILLHLKIAPENKNLKPEILIDMIANYHDNSIIEERINRKRELFFQECGAAGVSGEKLDELEKIDVEKYVMDTQLEFKAREKSLIVLPGLDNKIGFDFNKRTKYKSLEYAKLRMDSFLVNFIETPDSLRHARANQSDKHIEAKIELHWS